MSSQTFTPIQREAIWKAHSMICFYGKRPLDFKDVEIDHLVPEELLNDPVRKAKQLLEYGVPSTFNINGYENLVPACRRCNGAKRANLFAPTLMAVYLMEIRSAAVQIEKEIAAREIGQKMGIILRQAQNSIDKGLFTKEQFLQRAQDGIQGFQTHMSLQVEVSPIEIRFSDAALKDAIENPAALMSTYQALQAGVKEAHAMEVDGRQVYVVRAGDKRRIAFIRGENTMTILGIFPPGASVQASAESV